MQQQNRIPTLNNQVTLAVFLVRILHLFEIRAVGTAGVQGKSKTCSFKKPYVCLQACPLPQIFRHSYNPEN